jgi:hypothetical protein
MAFKLPKGNFDISEAYTPQTAVTVTDSGPYSQFLYRSDQRHVTAEAAVFKLFNKRRH